MRYFSIIVAFDSAYGIGLKNQLPWQLPADLRHFKEITTTTNLPSKKNAVVMGRNTWESLPSKVRPLPGRCNMVLTHKPQADFGQGVLKASSIDEALGLVGADIDQVFVIGGAKVYASAIEHPSCRSLYITHIKSQFSCDTFFPRISPQFMLISASEEMVENGIKYQFCHYMR
jgi:dihydrofolate reductase/thymidylate synthase